MELRFEDPELGRALAEISRAVAEAGGRALLVGGTVRDALLGLPASDLDLEVYGLAPERLRQLLEARYRLDLVGQSFGVLKLRRLPIDVSLPRRESKRGRGHRGFEVDSDPDLSFPEAASRRDFTLNAMGFDPLTGELLDPHGGRRDLEARRLRHVSEKFAEDPLRVLRGMQFAARFALRPHPETVELCRTLDQDELPRERIFEEWRKLVLRGRRISLGLELLRACGWISYYPELERLIDCPQDPEWHPEGDVWIHTLHVMDAFASQRLDEADEDPETARGQSTEESAEESAHDGDAPRGVAWENLVVGFACLCHDLGKPPTTTFEDGRIRSRGHEAEGERPTRDLLRRLGAPRRLEREVVPLVRDHLKPTQLHKSGAGAAAIRRLARRVGRIDRLVRVARADHAGRPPLPADRFPAGDWLLERARRLEVAEHEPRPIVMGRHLIELGLEPGPHFQPLLSALLDAQIEGAFSDLEGGLRHARKLVATRADD